MPPEFQPLISRLRTNCNLLQCRSSISLFLSRQNPSTLRAQQCIRYRHLHNKSILRLLKPIQPSTSLRSHARGILSAKPLPTRGPVFRFFYRFFAYAGGFILVSGGLIVAFFAYDATTYRELPVARDIPVSLSALNPPRGGPKNLPIVDCLIDDDDSEENVIQKDKPKLVVLGTGWGSVALLKQLRREDYHIVVVSPVNYFLFTPMLPSATVGTLELRSLVEPIRRIVSRVGGHFLKANAVDVEFSEKLVEVAQVDPNGVEQRFYLPYDKLVVGVGRYRAHQKRSKADNGQDRQAIRMVLKGWSTAITLKRSMMPE